MGKVIEFYLDGKKCIANEGQLILEAAKQNGIYIPSLCNIPGIKPRGACRICNVKVNGRLMTACTTPVTDGMQIDNNTHELNDLRKTIVELLFVEGNHFCPACERSGNCELQALAYRFNMLVPRFDYQFPKREIEAHHPKLIKDHDRCILCKRCVRAIKDESGKSLFAFKKRGHKVQVSIDTRLSANMSDELADKAAEICPVGAILRKGKSYEIPIGSRKYDLKPIGHEIEEQFSHNHKEL